MFLWFLCPHPSGEDCWILCQLSPPSFLPSFPRCQPSTTSRRVHCSLPDLHCKDRDHLRSVFPAGPPPRASAASVPCRTATATLMRPVFPAGPQLRPAVPSVPCRTSTATICAQCSLPGLHREIECQKECQKICQKECQKICQKECQTKC